MDWKPEVPILADSPESEPTKPSKPGSVGFEGATSGESPKIHTEAELAQASAVLNHAGVRIMQMGPEPLEDVLKGLAIELWSDAAGCLFIVADEDDVRRLGEPRGTVYTAAEMRRVVQIGDPATVLEIHEWKRRFNGRVREYQGAKRGGGLTI